MKSKVFLFLLFSFLFHCIAHPQGTENFGILFYNVENLFDIKDDPLTADDEFTPGGDRHWTIKRFNEKINNLSKVILSANGWNPPGMIGLCEVENRYVLEKLCNETPLKNYPYKIIHKDSPDDRGIDVAFLYNEEVFYPLNYKYYPLVTNDGDTIKSREILLVSGILNGTDTLHLYINHWPSRYSGFLETRAKRIRAAQQLNRLIAEKLKENRGAKIVVMGDFNDGPTDESVANYLIETQQQTKALLPMVNLSANVQGTLKYQSQWFTFDQFIVSGSLLNSKNRLTIVAGKAVAVRLPFLLEQDERYGGLKPYRSFVGYSYNGGFSDHLPVLLKLEIKN